MNMAARNTLNLRRGRLGITAALFPLSATVEATLRNASHGISNPQFRLQHYFLRTILQPAHAVKQQPRRRIA